MDPRMIAELGGDLHLTKITRPHKAMSVTFGPMMFRDIDKGSLIVCDNVILEALQYTVTRAVEDGTQQRRLLRWARQPPWWTRRIPWRTW